jgi:hypothetical protein
MGSLAVGEGLVRIEGLLDGLLIPITATQIADAYWHLHTQPNTAFTWELDIRPGVEKW